MEFRNNVNPLDKLIAMGIHHVSGLSGRFIKEMRDQGYNNLSVDDPIKLRIHGIDSEPVRKMKERQ